MEGRLEKASSTRVQRRIPKGGEKGVQLIKKKDARGVGNKGESGGVVAPVKTRPSHLLQNDTGKRKKEREFRRVKQRLDEKCMKGVGGTWFAIRQAFPSGTVQIGQGTKYWVH